MPTPEPSRWGTAPAENAIFLLDLAKGEKVKEIAVEGEPHGMALSPDGGWLYVVQRKLNQVAKINLQSGEVVQTAQIGQRPDMLAISPDGGPLFVTSRDENKLLEISAEDLSVQGEVTTDEEPHGVAYRQ